MFTKSLLCAGSCSKHVTHIIYSSHRLKRWVLSLSFPFSRWWSWYTERLACLGIPRGWLDTGLWAFLSVCCHTVTPPEALATALTRLILGFKALKLLGKWYLLKSQVWEGICALLSDHVHFSHLVLTAIFYGRAQLLLFLPFYKRKRLWLGGVRWQ